jgi:cytochrome c-type biogenesis protein CcmH
MMFPPIPLPFAFGIAAMLALALACVLPALVMRQAPRAPETASAVADLLPTQPVGRFARKLPLALLVALPALALGLYALLGDPAAARRTARLPMTADTPVSPAAMREELMRHLAASPRDGRGWVLLARMDFAADRFADAAASYDEAMAANPKIANDPAVLCELADALGMVQGGTLAGRPRDLVRRALVADPAHPKALEMAGSAALEAQDYAGATTHWRALLPLLPEGSREREELAAAIARADALAGRAGLPVQGSSAVR